MKMGNNFGGRNAPPFFEKLRKILFRTGRRLLLRRYRMEVPQVEDSDQDRGQTDSVPEDHRD